MPMRDTGQIHLLHELCALLARGGDAQASLDAALSLLASHGLLRGAVTLISPSSGLITIQAAHGLNAAERRRGQYLPGEGVTGQVIARNEAMCVSDIASEPLFLNRTRSRDLAREHVSFICVPIRLHGEAVGAISADHLLADSATLEEELQLLTIIAALIAPLAAASEDRAPEAGQRLPGFVGSSEKMRQVYEQLAIVAPSLATVFLQGESGTGKELAARAIHAKSDRAHGPFVSLNCAALPESLIESELFGHVRGAFTGATQSRKGRFELAHGGTLFLDEVGELGLPVQAKLLRVLQEHTFERLGGMETMRADVRVITATNRDLEEMAASGAFRRDLFYRLNVFPVRLPPLRERPEDILPLASHFLRRLGRRNARLSLAAIDMLQRHDWPGNVRELENVMERAALLLGRENIVLPQHLPAALRGACAENAAQPQAQGAGLAARLADVERSGIIQALEAARGHMGKAARALGLTERVLGLRMKKYALRYRDFRKAL